MEKPIEKSIYQSYALKFDKVNVADPNCTNKNLFVSVPIILKADDVFKSLKSSSVSFKRVEVSIYPKYNKVGPSDVLNTDDAAYVSGQFTVRYNFQKSCYVGEEPIESMAPFEVGGTSGISESTASIKYTLPSASAYLVDVNAGTTQTYQAYETIDTTNIDVSGKQLVFGHACIGVDRNSLISTKSATNISIGSNAASNRYASFCMENNKNELKPAKKGVKKQNPPDYNQGEEQFVEDPINNKLILDYYWVLNVRFDLEYTRSAKASAN